MTYGGIEIGKPTLHQVTEFISKHKLACDPQEVYSFNEKRGFLTKKGEPIKTLESMCNTYNGKIINQNRKNKSDSDIQEVRQKRTDVKQDFFYSPYKNQLSDPRWLAFRKFVFVVRGGKCEMCGATSGLNIHHLVYRKEHFAWEYSTRDVMVLCKHCHELIHKINK